ncbi:MAG: ribonuclease D [Magnetococcus sp. WYHC-3]
MDLSTPVILQGDLSEERMLAYLSSRFLAVDTETLGLNHQRDRLCLVQMCNENGLTTLVQIRSSHAPRLQQVLEALQVEKIIHFARFDMGTLRNWLNIHVNPVYCTRTASRLARTYSPRHGLKDVVHELLGVEMDKEQQSSDWASDLLSPAQVAYAVADVRHLIAVRERLEAMLHREGRQDLARQVMNALAARVSLDLAGWENEDIFAHH